jgi:uncharacterized protein (PEP-CTERM system associated)
MAATVGSKVSRSLPPDPAAVARRPSLLLRALRSNQRSMHQLLRRSVFAIAAAACCHVQAQSGGPPAFFVVPTLDLRQTFTDNVDLDPNGGSSESITEINPSVLVSGRGGRVSGTLLYSLNGVIYAGDSDRSSLVNRLNAFGTAEAIEGIVFVDAFANLSQQVISPFGQLPPNSLLPGPNSTQVFNYGISPYADGTLGGEVDYLVRLSYAGSKNADVNAAESTEISGLARLEGGTRWQRLRWALTALGRSDEYADARRTVNYGAAASLIYAVTPYFTLRGNAGVEYQDYATIAKQRSSVYGIGFDWQPTDRTLVVAGVENRFFGNAYRLRIQHRTPRTVWTFSDNYGVNEVGGVSTLNLGTNFELFNRQFASVEPDPILREQLVLDFLRANGIPADQQTVAGFLTTNVQLQRSQDLGLALVGRRNTLTFVASQTRTSNLIRYLETGEQFQNPSYVRQRGGGVNFSHRLTPISSISLALSQQRSAGASDVFGNKQTRADVNWTTRLGHRTSLGVSARHVAFDSTNRPYTENAVLANLSLRF